MTVTACRFKIKKYPEFRLYHFYFHPRNVNNQQPVMKRYLHYIILFLLIAGCCVACNKESNIPVSDSLIGTWELRMDINGMTGHVTHHKAGNDTIIKFTSNTYESRAKGKLIKSGTYVVKRDTFSLDHTLKNKIIYDDIPDNISTFFGISDNQLSFIIDAYDAPGVVYERIK